MTHATAEPTGTVTLRWTVPVEVVITVPDTDEGFAEAEERVRAVLATLGNVDDHEVRVVPDNDLPDPEEERP